MGTVTLIWIVAVLGLVYMTITLIAVIKIWRILEEIINSGAIPNVSIRRARKYANEVLRNRFVDDPEKLEELRRFLTSEEDSLLLQQIDKLKQRQAS